jgi:hypothetical protein
VVGVTLSDAKGACPRACPLRFAQGDTEGAYGSVTPSCQSPLSMSLA